MTNRINSAQRESIPHDPLKNDIAHLRMNARDYLKTRAQNALERRAQEVLQTSSKVLQTSSKVLQTSSTGNSHETQSGSLALSESNVQDSQRSVLPIVSRPNKQERLLKEKESLHGSVRKLIETKAIHDLDNFKVITSEILNSSKNRLYPLQGIKEALRELSSAEALSGMVEVVVDLALVTMGQSAEKLSLEQKLNFLGDAGCLSEKRKEKLKNRAAASTSSTSGVPVTSTAEDSEARSRLLKWWDSVKALLLGSAKAVKDVCVARPWTPEERKAEEAKALQAIEESMKTRSSFSRS